VQASVKWKKASQFIIAIGALGLVLDTYNYGEESSLGDVGIITILMAIATIVFSGVSAWRGSPYRYKNIAISAFAVMVIVDGVDLALDPNATTGPLSILLDAGWIIVGLLLRFGKPGPTAYVITSLGAGK
jgi:hypothetical protein